MRHAGLKLSALGRWKCSCGAKLNPAKAEVKDFESRSSQEYQQSEDRHPTDESGTFAAHFQCEACKEHYCVIGDYDVAGRWWVDEEDNPHEDWEKERHIKFVVPAPRLIELPAKTPYPISSEVMAAFELFWCEPGAALNRLRIALELMLDSLRVPKRSSGQPLKLHHRIERFASKHVELGTHLMALKWLGNAGAHETDINSGDALDAFEQMEIALSDLFDPRRQRVFAKAKSIVKKKGPLRKKKR